MFELRFPYWGVQAKRPFSDFTEPDSQLRIGLGEIANTTPGHHARVLVTTVSGRQEEVVNP